MHLMASAVHPPDCRHRSTVTPIAAVPRRALDRRRAPRSGSNQFVAAGVFSHMRLFQSAERLARMERLGIPLRWLIAIAATIAVIAAAAGVASTPAAAANRETSEADLSCVIPALPRGEAGAPPRAGTLSGPAVTALTGGAARSGFALDGGELMVKPPEPKDVPLLTADQALCGAMNATAGLSGSVQQGVAVGYGRVSVASKLFPAVTGFPYPGSVASQNPTVHSFSNRLAWLVVVHTNPVAYDCTERSASARPVAPRASDHGYEVFMIDARTGTDAIIYTEGGPGPCPNSRRTPPGISAAEESVSVPWTLLSRNPGGYSGTIAATVLPCDKVPATVLVDRGSPSVEVRVTRPFGPPCGPPMAAPISLHAAEVTADLPAVIGHDPVGLINLLSLEPSAPHGAATTTTTSPGIVSVDASMNGQTLELMVGQVVALQPLPGAQGLSLSSPAVSSNPAVVGPLTSGPQPLVAEFRAWKEGTADVTVPRTACIHPGSDQVPCNVPFVVSVVVR